MEKMPKVLYKVLNYQWATKKACMLEKQVKTINNNLATPINCKKTTIRKYWADNSGKYKDLTCKGISENKSNLTSGGSPPGIDWVQAKFQKKRVRVKVTG